MCRYDGKTKEINTVKEAFKGYEIIPFCPEAPLFGTPRERINVIEVDCEHRIVTDETDVDVTELLEEEIKSFCEKNPVVDAIVLKSKSPSCGHKTTPILNKKKDFLKHGDGIASRLFRKNYPNIKIQNELDF